MEMSLIHSRSVQAGAHNGASTDFLHADAQQFTWGSHESTGCEESRHAKRGNVASRRRRTLHTRNEHTQMTVAELKCRGPKLPAAAEVFHSRPRFFFHSSNAGTSSRNTQLSQVLVHIPIALGALHVLLLLQQGVDVVLDCLRGRHKAS